MKHILLVTLAGALVASLASCGNPDNVKPAEISSLEFKGYNCDQIGGQLVRNDREYSSAAEAYINNPAGMSAGSTLGGSLVISGSGGAMNTAERVALLKGMKKTLRETAAEKNCDLTEVDTYIDKLELARAEEKKRQAELNEISEYR